MVVNNKIIFNKIIVLVLIFLLGAILNGCPKSENSQESKNKEVLSGEYYSFQCDNGDYKVLKVLLAEENLIHICYYNNIFSEKPSKDVIQSLYFGEKKFQDAFISIEGGKQATGRKHMALTLENWEYWEPDFLNDGEVRLNELEAYEKWKNGDRYVSGILTKPTS